MTAGNDFDPELDQPTLFSARVTPHRSLNRTGFMVLMIFIGTVSFVAGIAFLLMGAWPVLGFFGLDVLVIYWAFRINFRSAEATEDIVVTPTELRVRRVNHRGHLIEWSFNPLWVQLEQTGDPEFGIERLYLVSRGRRVSIGILSGAGRKGKLFQSLNGSAANRQARHYLQSGRLRLSFLTRFLHANRFPLRSKTLRWLVGNRVVWTAHEP